MVILIVVYGVADLYDEYVFLCERNQLCLLDLFMYETKIKERPTNVNLFYDWYLHHERSHLFIQIKYELIVKIQSNTIDRLKRKYFRIIMNSIEVLVAYENFHKQKLCQKAKMYRSMPMLIDK